MWRVEFRFCVKTKSNEIPSVGDVFCQSTTTKNAFLWRFFEYQAEHILLMSINGIFYQILKISVWFGWRDFYLGCVFLFLLLFFFIYLLVRFERCVNAQIHKCEIINLINVLAKVWQNCVRFSCETYVKSR